MSLPVQLSPCPAQEFCHTYGRRTGSSSLGKQGEFVLPITCNSVFSCPAISTALIHAFENAVTCSFCKRIMARFPGKTIYRCVTMVPETGYYFRWIVNNGMYCNSIVPVHNTITIHKFTFSILLPEVVLFLRDVYGSSSLGTFKYFSRLYL